MHEMPERLARRAFGAAVLVVAAVAVRIDLEEAAAPVGAAHFTQRTDAAEDAEVGTGEFGRGLVSTRRADFGAGLERRKQPTFMENTTSLLFESLELGTEASSGDPDGYIKIIILFLPLIVAAPAVLLFVFYIILADEDMQSEIDERAGQLEDLGKTCDELADKVRGQIEDLVEKQIDWSQHDFNHKREDFIEFIEKCNEQPQKFGGDQASAELGGLLRDFIDMWFNVFKECSRCPVSEPMEPIPKEEFERDCPRDMVSISKWVAAKLEGVEVEFVDLGADKSNGKRDSSAFMSEPTDGVGKSRRQELAEKAKSGDAVDTCFPNWLNICGLNPNYAIVPRERRSKEAQSHAFPMELMLFCQGLKVNIVSPVHFLILAYFLILIPSCYFTFMVPHIVGAIILLVAWVMTIIVLARFEKLDVVAQLQAAQQMLIQEKEDVARIQRQLGNFFKNVDAISRLWACRTRPRLDLMKQVMRKLTETRWQSVEACKEFWTTINDAIRGLEKGIGGLQYYYYHSSQGDMRLFGKDGQALVRRLLEKVVHTIKANDAKEVTRKAPDLMVVPNLLAVRVLACHGLPRGTWTDDYDPYVRMRAKTEGDWVKTETKENETSPRFHSSDHPCEFRFNVDGHGKQLECEVMDDNYGEDGFLGEIFVAIDDIKGGRWTKMNMPLQDPVDPNTPGSLEIEVFLAREAEELLTLFPYDGPYEEEDEGDDDSDEVDSDDGSFL